MPRTCVFLIALILAMACTAQADVAPEPQYGQTIAPGKTPVQVEMVEENVTITLWPKSASVTAVFYLANRGSSATFEVGFPDVIVPSSYGSGPPKGVSQYKLRNFSATVDGEKVEHDYKFVQGKDSPKMIEETEKLALQIKNEKNPRTKEILQKRLESYKRRMEDWTYLGWIVWDMSFPAGKTRKVEVTYEVGYIPSYGPTLLGESGFEYILKTGAGWMGKIGKATVDVVFGEGMTKDHVGPLSPAGSKPTEKGFAWVLENFEPEENVRFKVRRYADLKAAAEAYHGYYEKSVAAKKPAASMLATAALCEEKAGLLEDCVKTCMDIIAIEKTGNPSHVIRWFKDGYEPWQCRLARCLDKLGRKEEAIEAATEAIAIIEALLGRTKRERPFVNNDRMKILLDECRKIGK